MSTSSSCLVWLILMSLVDAIVPLPILGAILIVVVLRKPSWFREMVRDVYGD